MSEWTRKVSTTGAGRDRCGCFNGAVSEWTRKAARRAGQSHSVRASMGPCPNGHGKSAMPPFDASRCTTLQWGRVRMDTESRDALDSTLVVWLLQWGRVRMDTESADQLGAGVDRTPASMGPCPNGHGKISTLTVALGSALLQWGRVRMDTESGKRGTRTPWTTRFNGAVSEWTRKEVDRLGRVERRHPASMGPCPNGHGKSSRDD